MNPILYILIFSGTLLSTAEQPCTIGDGSAYQRGTIPGSRPKRTLDESGNITEEAAKPMNTYFIYVQSKDNCKPQVTGIRIDNKFFNVTVEEITNLPVIVYSSHPGASPDTLVKQTRNSVYRINPGKERKHDPRKKFPNQNRTRILIEYKSKTRTNYLQIVDIKKLAPMILQ